MKTATISRGDTDVEITLLEEAGNPLVSVDVGKPTLQIQESGGLDPRHMDQHAGLMQFNIQGRFVGQDAYNRAINIANLLKSHSSGESTFLEFDLDEFPDPIEVAPAAGQQQAASIVYNPGRRNWVDVDVGLTRVSETQTGEVGDDQIEETPFESGEGPIEIAYQNQSVELVDGITVERVVGRHNSDSTGTVPMDFPLYQEKRKTAYDAFSLSLEFTSDAVSQIMDMIDMFTTRLGRQSMELKFNGLYGLGTFNVVPDGSNALRHQRIAGQQGISVVPTVSLRRVL